MVARASTGSTAPLRERATSPTQRPSATVSARGRPRLEHLDSLVQRGHGGQLAGDAAPGGGAPGVHDAPVGVASLEAQGEVAVAVGVEAHPQSLQVAHPAGRLRAQNAHRAGPGRVAPGGQGVGAVTLGRVVVRQRGGDAALGPVGGGLGERRAAHQRHARPLPGSGQRRVEAGRAGAHHGDVSPQSDPRRYRTGAMPVYFHHPSSLEHDTGPGHPERVARMQAIEAELERRDWLGYERREAPRATLEQLTAVHPQEYVDAVRETSARGGAFDLDTPTSEGSWEAALRAAGGACALTETLLGGGERVGFSALRPPGHHAEPARAMGFCLFANVSIAARHALDSLGAERVLVVDWDVHHGNGTNAIFHESPEVLFVSLHQYPFYPGTGALSDAGSGAGEGYSINLPVPAGAGEDLFCGLVEHVVLPAGRAFDPDLVLISAGFDAHRDDPVGGCALDISSFAELTRQLLTLDKPVGCVLEGGYDLDALAGSTAATMETLVAGGEPGTHPRGRAGGGGVRAGRPLLGPGLDQLNVGTRVAQAQVLGLALGAAAGVEAPGEDDPEPAAEVVVLGAQHARLDPRPGGLDRDPARGPTVLGVHEDHGMRSEAGGPFEQQAPLGFLGGAFVLWFGLGCGFRFGWRRRLRGPLHLLVVL